MSPIPTPSLVGSLTVRRWGPIRSWEQMGVHFLGCGHLRGVLSELWDLLSLWGSFSGGWVSLSKQ